MYWECISYFNKNHVFGGSFTYKVDTVWQRSGSQWSRILVQALIKQENNGAVATSLKKKSTSCVTEEKEKTSFFFSNVCHLPIRLADIEKGVCVDPERRPSPAAALGSAGRCAIESAPQGEDAETVGSPQHPKPVSATGLMSCPTHESPGHKHTSCILL